MLNVSTGRIAGSPTPPRSAAPPPARPARSTTTSTPGSSASRPAWPPPSGSATRSRASPCPGITGGTIPAHIWGQYMKVARGSYCGEFAQPTTPFVGRPFFGKYAGGRGLSGSSTSTDQSSTTPGAAPGASGAGRRRHVHRHLHRHRHRHRHRHARHDDRRGRREREVPARPV